MKLRTLWTQLGVVLSAIPLLGCASSKLSVPNAGKEIAPGMARVHFTRKYSIVGAAGAFYLLDRGTGVKYDVVFDGALSLVQENPGVGKCVTLVGKNLEVAVVADPTTGVATPICKHRDVIGREVYSHEVGTVSGRENAMLIGKVGPGKTLTWDRLPGVAKLEVAWGATSPDIAVEAGREYFVVYDYLRNRFDVKSDP